jgi:hypothetical protein
MTEELRVLREFRRCRCEVCTNVPSRTEGRIWIGLARRDKLGVLVSAVLATEFGLDGDTFIQSNRWEPEEWEALERYGRLGGVE